MTKKRGKDILNERFGKDKRMRRRHRIKLADAPPIKSLRDLIELGHSVKIYKNLDSVMLWRITPHLEELDKLIGMESLKDSVFAQILYYIQGLHLRNTEDEYLHTMLYGAPGSGKTTVAKIIGKLYKSLGILSQTGKFRIAYRDDFVAGYLGQTATKTSKLLKSCIGGVLFIDEIYSLAPRDNDRDSFSKEAIDTLTGFLSEHKNDFCCIAAGYEQEVEECFFGMNRGLKRRFPWIHKIQEYSGHELSKIFLKMVKESKWELAIRTINVNKFFERNKKFFKFAAGDVETFLSKCKIEHARRVIGLGKEHRFILTILDMNNALNKIKTALENKISDSIPSGLYL